MLLHAKSTEKAVGSLLKNIAFLAQSFLGQIKNSKTTPLR
jgi:hypothetical protein